MFRYCRIITGRKMDCYDCEGTEECQSCDGSGKHPASGMEGENCPSCDGAGKCSFPEPQKATV